MHGIVRGEELDKHLTHIGCITVIHDVVRQALFHCITTFVGGFDLLHFLKLLELLCKR